MSKSNWPLNSPSTLAESGHNDREFFAFKTNGTDSGFDKRTCDKDANATLALILAALGGGSAGVPVFDDNFNANSPGTSSTVNLITTSVTALKTRTFVSMRCSSRVGGRFELKSSGTIIAVIETGAGNYNDSFDFLTTRTGVAGSAITVDFIQSQGPANAAISVSLMSTEA